MSYLANNQIKFNGVYEITYFRGHINEISNRQDMIDMGELIKVKPKFELYRNGLLIQINIHAIVADNIAFEEYYELGGKSKCVKKYITLNSFMSSYHRFRIPN